MPTTPRRSSGLSATARRQEQPQMSGVAAKLNDREITAVADYIAGLR
jgi:cytochrome c553